MTGDQLEAINLEIIDRIDKVSLHTLKSKAQGIQ